ncbi:glutamate receptor-interacting protein 2-like isoform X2 [Convolutriloba macropyga]|uniref:glutamate receptor-interacting protein 2-like isoform X2 n=1 Tax=Convolutriloba macropyga TaxID=536237 RepID=UPI003F51D539
MASLSQMDLLHLYHNDQVVRYGPYGGSKETSPVSGGGGMNNYTHCTVSASLHSFHLQRETAILDSYERYDGTGKIYLEKVDAQKEMEFGIIFEAVHQHGGCLEVSEQSDSWQNAPEDEKRADSAFEVQFRVKSISGNSLASNTCEISPGDVLISINGRRSEVFKSKEELNEFIRTCERKLEMEVKYHVPKQVKYSNENTRIKSVEILLDRDSYGYGIVVRGGFNEETQKCRPITVTYIRQNSPVDQEGTIRPGDRIVAVNGIDLSHSSVPEVNDLLIESGQQALLRVEYDCSIIESVKNAQGALLVELGPTAYHKLGLSLTSFPSPYTGNIVLIDAITPASVADRCGALHVGDQILSVNGVEVSNLPISEIISLISMTSQQSQLNKLQKQQSIMTSFDHVTGLPNGMMMPMEELHVNNGQHEGDQVTRIEILPSRYARKWNGIMSSSTTGTSLSSAAGTTSVTGSTRNTPRHLASSAVTTPNFPLKRPSIGGGGGGILSRSMHAAPGHTSSNSRSLPPPSSWNRNRLLGSGVVGGVNGASGAPLPCGSMSSLASTVSSLSLPFLISRHESASVHINAQNHPSGAFGFSLYSWECLPSEPLRQYPVIDFVEPEGPAQLTGLLHVGDRVVAINERATLGMTLKDINQVLKESMGVVTLRTQFDVAETVVPSSGCFTVKLAKSGNRIGFRLYSSPYRRVGECPIILEVIGGSVAHRTGTICPGDRLLTINGISLADKTVDEAYNIMRSTNEPVVMLGLEKDDEFSDHGPNSHNMYSVELRPNSGRLGITLSGSEEPFDPIVIAAIETGSVADRIDVLHVNDQLVEICGCSLRGKTVKDAVAMLQNAKGTVQLKICRKFDRNSISGQSQLAESGFSSLRSQDSTGVGSSLGGANHGMAPAPPPRAPTSGEQDNESLQSGGSGSSVVSSPNETPRRRGRGRSKASEFSNNHSHHHHPHLPEPIVVNGNLIPPERLSNGSHDSALFAPPHPAPKMTSSHSTYSHSSSFGATTPLMNSRDQQSDKYMTNNPPTSHSSLGKPNRVSIATSSVTYRMSSEDKSRSRSYDNSDVATNDDSNQSMFSPEVVRISLQKSAKFRDFGFSVSNGDERPGIFINSIRPGGLAQSCGLKPMDKVLQINDMKLPDNVVCENVVPLIANSGPRVDIVVERRLSSPKTMTAQFPFPSSTKTSPIDSKSKTLPPSTNDSGSLKSSGDFLGNISALKSAIPDIATTVGNQFYDKLNPNKTNSSVK